MTDGCCARATLSPNIGATPRTGPGDAIRDRRVPTFAAIPAGWRLRVTLTTADTPHLAGGVYQVERNDAAASYLNVAVAPPSVFSAPCGAFCSAVGR
jgi:hypothetical protein